MQVSIGAIQGKIEGERKQAVGNAAPDILSDRALKRVREIQRQKRGLRALLQDPKVQAMLKINDEQFKKIESILKKERTSNHSFWYSLVCPRGNNNVPSARCAACHQAPHWLNLNPIAPKRFGKAVWDLDYDGRLDLLIAQDPQAFLGTRYSPEHDVLAHWINDFGQDLETLRQLFNVLTETQRKTLLRWVGEPYQSPSWQELWNRNK
jgi:hypothetical protein